MSDRDRNYEDRLTPEQREHWREINETFKAAIMRAICGGNRFRRVENEDVAPPQTSTHDLKGRKRAWQVQLEKDSLK